MQVDIPGTHGSYGVVRFNQRFFQRCVDVHPRRLVNLTCMFFNCVAKFPHRFVEVEFVLGILCD